VITKVLIATLSLLLLSPASANSAVNLDIKTIDISASATNVAANEEQHLQY